MDAQHRMSPTREEKLWQFPEHFTLFEGFHCDNTLSYRLAFLKPTLLCFSLNPQYLREGYEGKLRQGSNWALLQGSLASPSPKA